MTLSQALIGEAVPPRQRGRFQGYLAAIFMCSIHHRPSRGRMADPACRLAVRVPGQPATRPDRGGVLLQRLAARPGKARVKFQLRHDPGPRCCSRSFVVPLLLALERAQQRFDLGRTARSWPGWSRWRSLRFTLLLRQERRSSEPLIPVRLLGLPAIWRCGHDRGLHRGRPHLERHLHADLPAGRARRVAGHGRDWCCCRSRAGWRSARCSPGRV